MTEYEWTHETPLTRRGDETVTEGDVFHPTDHEQRVWGGRMREVATCDDTTNDGRPCTRTVDGGSEFCWQHRDTDDSGDTDTEE